MPKKSSRGMGSIYLRGTTYWIKYYRNGQPRRESSHSESKQDAIDLLKQRLGESVTGAYLSVPASRIRMEGLFQMVIDDYITNDKHDIYQVKRRVRQHLNPGLGHIRASDLTTDQITKYVHKRKREGAENATINRELSIIRRAFTLGSRTTPPKVGHIPAVSKLPEDNARQGFIEDEQYEKLLACLERAKAPLVIGYHLGIRKGEILALEWAMVDLDAREIRLPGRITKNGKPRTLPIYGALEGFLRVARAEKDSRCRFVCADGPRRILSFKGEWEAATEKAGLKGLLFHDLRRSAIRNMVRAGIPDLVAMQISGHKTRSVFDRYNIVSRDDIQNAGKALERAQTAKKTGTD